MKEDFLPLSASAMSTSKSKTSVAASKTAVQSNNSTNNGVSKSSKTGTAASKAASTSNPGRVSTTAVVSRTSVVKQQDSHWVSEFEDNLDGSMDSLKTDADAAEDVVAKKQDFKQKYKITPPTLPKKSLKNAKIHIAEEEERKESATTAPDESEIPSTLNSNPRKPDNSVKVVRANSRKCGGPQAQVFITFAIGFLIGGGGAMYISGIL